MDLFQPPKEARGMGRVPADVNRVVWEAFSSDQWQRIHREYGVSQVLTSSDWKLRLPIIAESPEFKLYGIP
jgi:hypothetical protein